MTNGTLPVTGPLSLKAIQTAFGLSGSLSLSQLYRGGSIIPNGPPQNAGVPSSGAISFSNLYGATNVVSPSGYTFTTTISASTQNYNVANAAVAAGWNGTQALFATITINSGVYVGSSNTGAYGLTVPALPANSTVTIICNGAIVGAGGAGGAGGSATYGGSITAGMTSGTAGGPALLCQAPTILKGGGFIGGGGGGGGGGEGWFGYQTVHSGGHVTPVYYVNGGGGGGAGAGYNSGGVGGGGTASGSVSPLSVSGGASGAPGSNTGGGAGGAPGMQYPAGSTAVAGGPGGSLGQPGGTGSDGGGAAGYAITGNNNLSIQWSGTVFGPVS